MPDVMRDAGPADLEALVAEAVTIGDVVSAVIFVDRGTLQSPGLAAAAGIVGPPLDGLVAAVQNPAHPVTRAFGEPEATFDVLPINPGGPKLRSHLPIRAVAPRTDRAAGVLAVAHDDRLSPAERARLVDVADRAGTALERVGSSE